MTKSGQIYMLLRWFFFFFLSLSGPVSDPGEPGDLFRLPPPALPRARGQAPAEAALAEPGQQRAGGDHGDGALQHGGAAVPKPGVEQVGWGELETNKQTNKQKNPAGQGVG